MSNYRNLVTRIVANIKRNGAQEITGDLLQEQLLAMVSSLGKYYQMGGVVSPADHFTEGDESVCFIGVGPGTFADFGGFTLESGQVAAFLWNGVWRKQIISYYGNTGIYGVRHYYNNASPDLTRIGDAALHRDLPVQSQMRRCIVDDLGNVKYYLDANDSTKKVDGTPADLSGADGQFMVEIPRHYRRISVNETLGYMDAEISLDPFTGAVVEPRRLVSVDEAVLDRQENKLCAIVNTDARYRGGNNTADWDGTYRDLRGKPVTNINLHNFREYARARGTRWSCYDYASHLCIYWLFVIEYATLDSQKAFNASLTPEGYRQGGLGPGVSTFYNWETYCDYNPFIPCGFTNSLGNNTGVVTFTADSTAYGGDHTESVPSYRGIANPFGHLWKIMDGFIGKGVGGNYQEIFICRDPEKYADSITADYQDLGHEATADGYCKAIIATQPGLSQSIRAYGDIFDRDDSGSASTFFCDHHWHGNADGSLYLLLFGGSASNGSYDGLACVSAAGTLADSGQYDGSRLVWTE